MDWFQYDNGFCHEKIHLKNLRFRFLGFSLFLELFLCFSSVDYSIFVASVGGIYCTLAITFYRVEMFFSQNFEIPYISVVLV